MAHIMAEKNSLEVEQLRQILPHAYPFLLIDRVEDYEVGKSLVAIKNVTGNECDQDDSMYKVKYFPETLLIEAAAQAAIVLYHVTHKTLQDRSKQKYSLGRTRAEFFKQVESGNQVDILVLASKMLKEYGYMDIE